jgi:hypothetical protein
MWEIGGATPTGGALYAIWGIEALIILVPAILIALSADTPFCEPCNVAGSCLPSAKNSSVSEL